ncbi:ComEC/Rec2 family competence protein [Treponema vincentii]|uniref:ComEC/Rec2 family competence protein n=1 Tax=Treponema vincentii TaxID=69710 RepID=UPI0035F5735F
MDRHVVPPVTIIAVAAAAFFYGLYVFAQTDGRITSFVFITTFLLLCAFLLFLAAVPIAAQLTHRKFQPQHCRQKQVRAMVRFALCIMAGAAIGSYAARTLQREQRPPQTLASLSTVRTLIAELTGEAVPAGSDYYRIPVKLIACSTGRSEQFSASGSVQLFVPAALVCGTYSGGITRIGEAEQSEKTIPLLRGTAAFADYLQNPQECRFYVRGMKLAVQGKFGKTGTVFYARSVQPVFLGWNSPLSRFRAFFRFAFMRMLYGWGEAGGLLLALLAADKAFLPAECIAAFRNAGLAHILALSGMHLSLIGTAALQGGRLFGHKSRAAWFSLAAVFLFVWFAGAAPSLNRALGMVCITAAGRALGLKPPPLSVLCAMLTVHIAIAGTEAMTLGFMLSYGACAGIIIFGDACAHLLRGKIPPAFASSISASVGAQLFTAPIVISAIGNIAAAGVIASCAVSPLVSVFLIAGLICIPLALIFPFTSPLLGYGLNAAYRIIFASADFFACLPVIAPESGMQRVLFSAAAFSAGLLFTAWAYLLNKRAMTQLPRLT